MSHVEEVYLVDPRAFELGPFQDRVVELVRLFHDDPAVRLRILGVIAAGEPIEAVAEPESIEIHSPAHAVQRRPLLRGLRRYLCPALQRVADDAFEIARVITPLLAALKVSGKVAIDLDPWLFAGLALEIERIGVAAFCVEEDDADDAIETSPVDLPPDAAAAPGRRLPSTPHAAKPAPDVMG